MTSVKAMAERTQSSADGLTDLPNSRISALELRWSDIQDGRAIITRSLTQTRQVLAF
jgi:hypothetical protein